MPTHLCTATPLRSIKPTGELEKKSLHTACPVIKGVKWSAAKWIHVGHYAMGNEQAQYVEQHPDPLPKAVGPNGERPRGRRPACGRA